MSIFPRKIGFTVYNEEPEKYFDYAYEHKLKHIEINLEKDYSELARFDKRRVRKINKLAKEKNIKLSIHLPFSLDEANVFTFKKNPKSIHLRESILLAKNLKATHIIAHIGKFEWYPVEHLSRRKALSKFTKFLSTIIDFCEVNNVVLCLENLSPVSSANDYYLLGDSINDFKFIFSQVQSKHLKFCLDTGHANCGEGVIKILHGLYDKLHCIHFHDNDGKNDEHKQVASGTVPWLTFAKNILELNYNGLFISECRNVQPHKSAELLRKYFQEVTVPRH
ncbi:MAG: sugar phosphate isomerase/epimerase [Ignavibacteriales bacterium]|nr:sugar phosphate isomerase/epimerase [Ignavibacteriales bacterium]